MRIILQTSYQDKALTALPSTTAVRPQMLDMSSWEQLSKLLSSHEQKAQDSPGSISIALLSDGNLHVDLVHHGGVWVALHLRLAALLYIAVRLRRRGL